MENSNNPYTPPKSILEHTENASKPMNKKILTVYSQLQGKKPTFWQVITLNKKGYAVFFLIILILAGEAIFLIKQHEMFLSGCVFGLLVGLITSNFDIITRFCSSWNTLEQVINFDKIKQLLNNKST